MFDFDQIADNYDQYYTTVYGKRVDLLEKNVVRHLLARVPKSNTLELGCGTGHWTRFFRHLGYDIMGVDISEKMLQIARSKLPSVECIKADITQLPFDNESFDNVFVITAMEFVDDRQKAFNEAFRVLKTGGYFLIGALNADSELGRRKKNSSTYKEAEFFTPQSLEQILSNYGSVEMRGAVVMHNDQILDYYKVLPDRQRLEKGAFIAALVRKSLK